MPAHLSHTVKAGSRGRLVFVLARDRDGRPRAGLGPSDGRGAFIREGEAGAASVELIPGRVGEWAPGSLAEVDSELMPGVYQLGVPDDLVAEGARSAMLLLEFAGVELDPIRFTLVAYDPQDGSCIGLGQLQDHMRHQFLRRALPRLTEMELEMGRESEQRLTKSLDEPGGSERD